jgi:phosphoserine phosphatase RsbX
MFVPSNACLPEAPMPPILFSMPFCPSLAWALRPFPGETACGDAAGAWCCNESVLLAMADGLGHGPMAAKAAQAAMDCIGAVSQERISTIFEACDAALQNTRGAALGLIRVWPRLGRFEQLCVGNIRAVWVCHDSSGLRALPDERRLGASRGIVGAGFDRLCPESFTLNHSDWLFLYTDGIPETAPLGSFFQGTEGLLSERVDQALRLHCKSTDDAGLLAYHYE